MTSTIETEDVVAELRQIAELILDGITLGEGTLGVGRANAARAAADTIERLREENARREWQPIETADKDARSLFFIDAVGDPRVGRWNPSFNYWQDLHTGKPMPHPMFWCRIPDWSRAALNQQ